jgi:sugar O-acyltransferase (sialic acid O-acetyltransferase NeuD family)
MSKLVLIAASGLAREVLTVVRESGEFREVTVLDDDPGAWGTELDGEPVEGGLDLVTRLPRHQVLVCAGRGVVRRTIVHRLAALGVNPGRYARIVHPDADVPAGCTVGVGTVVLSHVALTTNVRIGNHVVVMPNVTLTHDDVVEEFATLCAGVSLGGGVEVRSGAYLGMNSSVREGLVVGMNSVLGMGGALVEDLPRAQVWAGVPARPLSVLRSEAVG